MANIVAVVVTSKTHVDGGAPIFVASNEEEQKKVAFTLEKILDASAHDLKNGTIILVHRP